MTRAAIWSVAWSPVSPAGCTTTAPMSKVGCGLCAPMPFSATATRQRDAAADAKRALADHPEEIKRIDDLVKGLGLEG